MRITQFANHVLPQYNKRDVVGQGASPGALLPLPGAGSFDGYGTDQAPEDTAEIVTSFEIIDTTAAAVQTEYDAIRALRGTYARLWARMPDVTDRFIWARLARFKMERKVGYIYWQPVELTFQAANPGWHGRRHGAGWTLDSGYYLDAGMYFDMGGTYVVTLNSGASTTTAATIANNGNRTVTDVTLTVTAVGDQITYFKFSCGNCEWEFSGTIASGKSLVVDCDAKSVLNDGANAYSSFTLTANHASSNWCELASGNNAVTFTSSSGAGTNTVTVTFHDGWE